MPIVNSSSKEVVREFSIEELEQAARLMRGYDLVALCAAGSGHSGGTLSMMEIVAALYLKVANHDPNNPDWSRTRPHHLVGRAQGAGAVSRSGIRRLFPHRRHRYPAQTLFAIPGTSAPAEAAGRRGLQRIAGAGPEHRRGHGDRRQARQRRPHGLLHHGRWRAAGRQHLGSGDGGVALQARQSGGHHRPQPPADRRLGEGRDERRAAGGALSQLRLGGASRSTVTTFRKSWMRCRRRRASPLPASRR